MLGACEDSVTVYVINDLRDANNTLRIRKVILTHKSLDECGENILEITSIHQ